MSEIEKRNKFRELMFDLDVYYTTFKFFDGDKEREKAKLRVWYNALQIIPSDRLEYVINDYCIKNVYAPTSPTNLIEHYRSIILNYYPNAELTFEKFIEKVRINGYDLAKHIEAYHKFPFIQETLKRLQSDFEMWRVDKGQLPYFKKHFIETYNKVIQEQVNEEKLKLGE